MAGQLTGLHAKITGDSTSFRTAAKLAAFELNKLDAKARETKRNTDALASSSEGLARAYDKLRAETDAGYAAMQRFEKAVQTTTKYAQDQKWTTEQLGAEINRLANHYGVAEQAGLAMNDQIRSARFHTANLSAQMFDIGVMMASGQSPFMLAVQQGSQVSQVMQTMGGTAKQQFAALASAIGSLISPTTLLTVGVIAGVAALGQWALAAGDSGEKAVTLNDAVDGLSETMELYRGFAQTAATDTAALTEQFGAFAGKVQEFSSYLAGVALAQTMEELQAVLVPLKGTLGDYDRLLGDVAFAQAEVNRLTALFEQGLAEESSLNIAKENLRGFKENLDETAISLGLTGEQATKLSALMDELGQAESMVEIARAAGAVLDYMKQIVPAGQDLPPALREAAIALETMQKKAAEAAQETTKLSGSAPGTGWMGTAIGETNMLISRLIAANAEKERLMSFSGANYDKMLGLTGQSSGPDAARTQTQFGGGAFAAPVKGAGLPYVSATGGGGGGESVTDKIQADLEKLQETLMTQEQLEMESYARRQELLKQSLDQKLLTQEEYARLMEQVEATHQFAMLKEQNEGARNTLDALGTIFQGSKTIGAGIALANSWLAFTEVLKDPAYVGRPWERFAAAAAALASGLNAVRNIKSASSSGSSSGGGASTGGQAGNASAPQQAVQTLNFTIQNDPFGYGERFARQMAAQLNEAQRNGSTLIQATVT